MTTGYVAKLHDGAQTFSDFTLGCARAFGYLIDMRESPNDAAVVAVKVIDPQYAANLEAARLALNDAALQPMSHWDSMAGALAANAGAKRADEVAEKVAATAKSLATIARYEQMLEQVNAWQSPSPDHDELKKFMIGQLTQNIEWSTRPAYTRGSVHAVHAVTIPVKTAKQLRDETMNSAQRNFDDCTARLAKETQQIAERNLWVAQLFASVR